MQQADSYTTYNPLEDRWEAVLEPYGADPINALILVQNFQAIKDVLETGPSGTVRVIRSMDDAIEILFPFSEYYKAGLEFFLLAVKRTLKPAFDLTKPAEQARSEADCDEN
jgi:hypothetical protein